MQQNSTGLNGDHSTTFSATARTIRWIQLSKVMRELKAVNRLGLIDIRRADMQTCNIYWRLIPWRNNRLLRWSCGFRLPKMNWKEAHEGVSCGDAVFCDRSWNSTKYIQYSASSVIYTLGWNSLLASWFLWAGWSEEGMGILDIWRGGRGGGEGLLVLSGDKSLGPHF